MKIYLTNMNKKYVLDDVVKIEEFPIDRNRCKVTFSDNETQIIEIKEITKIEY